MRRSLKIGTAAAALIGLFALAGCTTDPGVTAPSDEPSASSGGTANEWFDQAIYDKQFAERSVIPQGPEDEVYLQHINAEMVDTSAYASPGAKKACFANASISNPWRQTGWITMNQQLKVLQDSGAISSMETRDAQDSDDTQIADIDYFIGEGNCDVFIISPNSTAAMTPAVERACATNKPVIVFDRGVETDCPVTFIHPIGGFAWGIDTAEFLIENLQKGDKVVGLR
ncbi:MAG: substrate-binding domain-containing protein, partial [Microbacteriaceae bacterium]|nr:substrate-binding domain-containing protein [Microbacteriaceae bacterium]